MRRKLKKNPYKPVSAAAAFGSAVSSAAHLDLKPGLSAVKKSEGRDRIQASPSALLGSVNVDDDCRPAYPEDNRWDYLIGVARGGRAIAHFVEVHSAHSSEVSTMDAKLAWLKDFVQEQEELSKLPQEYHWVASKGVRIPQHLPQYKRLKLLQSKQGLNGPVTALHLT